MSCGTTAMASRRLCCVTCGDVLPIDQDATRLDVVEALQERKERRLAAAGGADEADALARPDVKAQIIEDDRTVRIGERHLLEGDAGAAALEGGAPGQSQSWCGTSSVGERFRESRHVLGDVDERDGEIARGVQYREAERAYEDHVARWSQPCAARARSPTPAAPRSVPQSPGHARCAAARGRTGCAARDHLAGPPCRRSAGARAPGRRRPARGHVADHVRHFSVDGCRATRRTRDAAACPRRRDGT